MSKSTDLSHKRVGSQIRICVKDGDREITVKEAEITKKGAQYLEADGKRFGLHDGKQWGDNFAETRFIARDL
ncbi:MAG: hypothetical protein HC769_19535 [Cyanobacteria bacterium CRU_2_1]|nr:hypothetical protein [Cyanobacteria bacterium RU_5_0]NJR60818.1 hypothetical protein [Cyanobacteria bacterium CRU_2_1]